MNLLEGIQTLAILGKWLRANLRVVIGVILSIMISFMIAAFIFAPPILVNRDCQACNNQEKIKAMGDTRTALVQLFLAIGAGGTLYFTWRNSTQTAKDAAANQALTREARVSENFVKAVEQLGSEKSTLHIGGIYGLDRVLRATEEGKGDYWAVMDVLSAFIRQNYRSPQPKEKDPRPEPAPEDLQAALDVLARRWIEGEVSDRQKNSPVDLHGTNLANTWMANGHFEYGFFVDCDLRDADLASSNFMWSDFSNADLSGAKLSKANLSGIDLRAVKGLNTAEELDQAIANGRTRLSSNISRPSSWPTEEPEN